MGLYDCILLSFYNGTNYISYISYPGKKQIFKMRFLVSVSLLVSDHEQANPHIPLVS